MYSTMAIDTTKLNNIFISGTYSDTTLKFNDENHTESINIHRNILSIYPCDYFHTLFSRNTNKNIIPIDVWDAYVAYDCIANYFYKVDINKGNLKPSVHLVKSIQCYDFFGIEFNPDLSKNIEFTEEEFDALLDITYKIGFEKYFRIIKKYFPNNYCFVTPKLELYYDILKYTFNKHILAVVNNVSFYGNVNIMDMEGNNSNFLPVYMKSVKYVCNKIKYIVFLHAREIDYYGIFGKKIGNKSGFTSINLISVLDCNEQIFFDALENFNQYKCDGNLYWVIDGDIYTLHGSKLSIIEWYINDVYKNGNMLLCTKNNECMIIDCETRQIIKKNNFNVSNCHFITKNFIAYTRDTSVEIWNFRKDEHKILGCHDNYILCSSVIANNLWITCDIKSVVKIWDANLSQMLYCSKKLCLIDLSKVSTLVGFLTRKFLDKLIKIKYEE